MNATVRARACVPHSEIVTGTIRTTVRLSTAYSAICQLRCLDYQAVSSPAAG